MDRLLRATADAEARHFWFQGFRSFVAPLLRQATTGISDVWLLDCGCGTGANVAWLRTIGRAYGFDASLVGLQLARKAGRTGLVRADVGFAPFPSNRFDIVTSFDVLYSLETDAERAAVAEMYRLTKPGGFVLVNVAAMESLRGNHSVLSREVRRYSRASLRKLLTDAGFSVVRLTYTNATLFLPLLAIRTIQRWRGLSTDDDTADGEIAVPPAAVNAVLSAALRLESLWLRAIDNPFGSSLLCLARKGPPQAR